MFGTTLGQAKPESTAEWAADVAAHEAAMRLAGEGARGRSEARVVEVGGTALR
jgi:hypothetical protein